MNPLAWFERDASELEHLGRTHSASLDEVHGHIDQKRLVAGIVKLRSRLAE